MRLLPILFVNDNPIAAVSVLFDWHVLCSVPLHILFVPIVRLELSRE